MVCRNKERAEAAKDEIIERSKNQVKLVASSSTKRVLIYQQMYMYCLNFKICAVYVVLYVAIFNGCNIYAFCLCFQNVYVHILDLSSARQVWEFANNFSINNTLHVLVSAT